VVRGRGFVEFSLSHSAGHREAHDTKSGGSVSP
jgi:hypothetical protein